MNDVTPSTRRDPRFRLPPGSAWVEFDHPLQTARRCSAELTMISVAGLDLALDASTEEVASGAVFSGAAVQVGDYVFRGTIMVKNSATDSAGRTHLGCLFYPADPDVEEKLMVLITGIEVAQARA